MAFETPLSCGHDAAVVPPHPLLQIMQCQLYGMQLIALALQCLHPPREANQLPADIPDHGSVHDQDADEA